MAENRRSKMTKQMLKASLIELMHNQAITKITIKELCENADVNRSTFYLYYNDQHELLKEIENELLFHVKEDLDKLGSNPGTLPYLEAMLSYIMKNADIFRTLLCHQESPSFQATFVQLSSDSMMKNLDINCSETLLPYVYDFLLMGCLNMIKRWIESDFNINYKSMAQLIFQLSDKAVSAFQH